MGTPEADDGSIRLSELQPATWDHEYSEDERHMVVHGDATRHPRLVLPPADIAFIEPPGVHPTSTRAETRLFFEEHFRWLKQRMKKNSALILLPRDRKGHPFLKSVIAADVAQEFGWLPFRRFIWQWGMQGFHRASYSCHDVFVFRRGSMSTYPCAVKYKDLIKVPRPKSTAQYVQEIPVEIPYMFLRLFIKPGGNPNMVMLDPFAGGGAAMEAAHRAGIQSVNIELERKRYEELCVQVKRLSPLQRSS